MRLSTPIYRLKRQAKLLSREAAVPLNEALDSLAKQHGFQNWSHLAAYHGQYGPATKIRTTLNPGDLVLLGARPGQGKTLLGLELIAQSIKTGNQAVFYSLEYTEKDIVNRFEALGGGMASSNEALTFDTSDDICADYIVGQLSAAPRSTIVVVDYLQLLDQNRQKPVLSEQVSTLKSFAASSGLIIILLSQIDRSYDPAAKPLPDMTDVRLPNPLDLKLFTRMIFLNNGDVNLQDAA